MLEENIALVLDILIEKKKPMSISELSESSELENSLLSSAINIIKLLELATLKQDGKLHLNKIVKGINLAKAAQLGLDLLSFNFFEISKAEKKIALELATKAEKIKTIEIQNRKPFIQKRNQFSSRKTDDVADNLIIILEASNQALYEYLEKLAEKDDYLKSLMLMHDQTEKSLASYLEYLK